MVQLKRLRSDLNYQPIRGNVDTRVHKCQQGTYDALVLAEAGLKRLGMLQHIQSVFHANQVLPAVGQGALGIEAREEDKATQAYLQVLHHEPTYQCVMAERAMNAALGGNCQVPVAGFAQIENNILSMQGLVGHPEHALILQACASGSPNDAVKIGLSVAEDLRKQGATELMADLLHA
jgi:hydroxymethylbilane synthase